MLKVFTVFLGCHNPNFSQVKTTLKKGNIFSKLEIRFSKSPQMNLEHRLHIRRHSSRTYRMQMQFEVEIEADEDKDGQAKKSEINNETTAKERN